MVDYLNDLIILIIINNPLNLIDNSRWQTLKDKSEMKHSQQTFQSDIL